MLEKVRFSIFRGVPGHQYWEEFLIPFDLQLNVISALMHIQKHPVNLQGKKTAPVVWESGCLEEVCGSCSMLINGIPQQACSALVHQLTEGMTERHVRLAPLTKFPLVRDLMVDRTVMFDNLKTVQAWVEADGYFDIGFGPKLSQKKQEIAYILSTCMTCGCCSESCPQVSEKTQFMGPAPIAQVRLFSIHPTAKNMEEDRLRVMQTDKGVISCGNAQNCVRVCPKRIPLTDSIAAIGRDVSLQALRNFFSLPER